MSVAAILIGVLIGVLVGIAAGYWLPPHGRGAARSNEPSSRRILLPFTGQAISRRAFEAAVRLAKAENAIVMPAFLARVPMNLPIDSALPVQCANGMPLLEAIEQNLSSQGVPVDSRVGRGRTARDALRNLLAQEHFDRIIVSANEDQREGLGYDDLKWLLERVPAEVMILRPAPDDTRRVSAEALSGHF
jgi:nucleotide-binding universal stress UspA family protein